MESWLTSVKCNNHKDVMKFAFHDDRWASSFNWHLKYGPGHVFGRPGSRYFRSNRKIPCYLCEASFRAEKDLVRHLRLFHVGASYTRAPISKFCFKVNLSKISYTKYKDTASILLPKKVKKCLSTGSKKMAQPKCVKKSKSKPKKITESSKSANVLKAKKVLKTTEDVKQRKSGRLI